MTLDTTMKPSSSANFGLGFLWAWEIKGPGLIQVDVLWLKAKGWNRVHVTISAALIDCVSE